MMEPKDNSCFAYCPSPFGDLLTSSSNPPSSASHPHSSSLTAGRSAKTPEQRQVFGRLPVQGGRLAPPCAAFQALPGLRLRRTDARLSFGHNREFSVFWPENSEAGTDPSRHIRIYSRQINRLWPNKATFL